MGFFKRFIKVLISIVYFIITTIIYAFYRIFRGSTPSTLIIILYHSVLSDQKDKFIKHIQFLKKVGISVFPEIDRPIIPGLRHIALTFDDGFENFYKNALPVLQEQNVLSTVFVPTDFIGSKQRWMKNTSRSDFNEKLMSENQLADLPPAIVKIGSHCKSHTPLSKLDKKDINIELEESKQILERLLGREIRLLALPHGSFCPDITEISLKAGYDRVFTCVPVNQSTNFTDVFAGRIDITMNDWSIEYKLKYLGAYQWERYIFKLNNKLGNVEMPHYSILIYLFHELFS